MKQGSSSVQRTGRPSPAMIIAIIALVASLSGSAYAAIAQDSKKLKRNIVGTKQLKNKSVKTGKLANNAVRSRNVRDGSLTGQDIRLAALGTVPAAGAATHAGNTGTVTGHAAGCPGGTTLIRGICFDSASNSVVGSVTAAADGCAAKGGFLPSPQELYSTRGVLNLGTGIGTDHQFTDTYYSNASQPPKNEIFRTVVINGTGTMTEVDVNASAEYICAYPLIR
jgi:hypothetical protein